MRFGTWKVRSRYGAGTFVAAAKDLGSYKLELMCVQDVRWDREGTIRVWDYNFVHGKRNKNHKLCKYCLYSTQ